MHVCRPRILWIGGGSLGLLFAGKCALSSCCHSELLVRSSVQKNEIVQKGLRLAEHDSWLTASLPCAEEFRQLSEPDWICLMVKQMHIEGVLLTQLEQMAVAYPHARWLCFQNGIGHAEKLQRFIPPERLFMAITTEAARRVSKFEVEHTGSGTTMIGAWKEVAECAAEKNLRKALCDAGFEAFVSNNIKEVIWKKLLINVVVNPLTALLKVRNGELIHSQNTLEWMRALFDEGVEVAQAEGIIISDDHWEELLHVCERTASNYSSMLQDVLHNRQTEIEWLNGSLLRLGAKHHLELPNHTTLYKKIKELEKRRMSHGTRRERTTK